MSVRIIATASVLQEELGPIILLDSMLSGAVSYLDEISITAKQVSILKSLLSSMILQTEYEGTTYIYDTFKCFINNKRRLMIDIPALSRYCRDYDLLQLIFSNSVKSYDDADDADERMIDSSHNLINPQILKIFRNVQSLELICSDHYDSTYYPIPLLSLLSVIRTAGSQIQRVLIRDGTGGWISKIIEMKFEDISNEYRKMNYYIEIMQRPYCSELTISAI